MTAPAQPPAHCGHECVCRIVELFAGEECALITCPHDTRRQQPQQGNLIDILEERITKISDIIDNMPSPSKWVLDDIKELKKRQGKQQPDALAELEMWITDNSSLFKYEDPRYMKPGMRRKIITLVGYVQLREKISAIRHPQGA